MVDADREDSKVGEAGTCSEGTESISVLLLCGLPGSGKSTLSQKIKQFTPACTLLEYDAFQSDFDSIQSWHEARIEVAVQLQSQICQQSCGTVLLDDNFHLKSMRKQVYNTLWQLLSQNQAQKPILFGIIHVDTPFEECIRRNESRVKRQVTETVIHRMHCNFDVPSSTNYWEQAILNVTDTTTDCEDMVTRFLANGLQTVECPPYQTKASVDPLTIRQQADLFLRRAVKAVALCTGGSKAKLANGIRQKCLRTNVSNMIDSSVDANDWLELFLAGDWLTNDEETAVRNDVSAVTGHSLAMRR